MSKVAAPMGDSGLFIGAETEILCKRVSVTVVKKNIKISNIYTKTG